MKTIILLFFIGAFSSTINAQTTSDVRQKSQRVRIHAGVNSGEITRPEQRRLNTQQRHIRRVERRAKADGVYTPRERRIVNRKQNQASRNIKRKKTNEIN